MNFHGYNHQARQPRTQLAHDVRIDGGEDLAAIDAWLVERFGIAADVVAALPRPAGADPADLAAAMIARVLVLYGDVLRAADIPSFDDGMLVRAEALDGDGRTVRAVVDLPAVDNFPEGVLTKLYADLMALVSQRLAAAPGDDAEPLLDQVDRSLVRKLRSAMSFGTGAVPLCEIAFKRDIPFRHLGGGVMQFGWGARAQLYSRASLEKDSAVGVGITQSKQLTTHLLKAAGFPVTEHLPVDSRDAALAAARRFGWPVVVKPDDQARSIGVTVNIRDEAALRTAFDSARSRSLRVLVERQLAGVCHRILVAGDAVAYVVRRDPKGVVGNGTNTVAELVAMTNAEQRRFPPWKRLADAHADNLAAQSLAEVGLTLESVPAPGERAPLRPLTSDEWGGIVDDCTDTIHPDNASLAIEAARAFGLGFAGIDLMTVDIAQPWHANGAAILEVNAHPGFSLVGREVRLEELAAFLVPGDGRIPVHLVIGEGDLGRTAASLAGRLRRAGRRCAWTSASRTAGAAGEPVALPGPRLLERCLAQLLRRDVEELVIVDEALALRTEGLAVDRLESVLVQHPDSAQRTRLAGLVKARFRVGRFLAVGADGEPDVACTTVNGTPRPGLGGA